MTRLAFELAVVLLASLGASGQSKISIQRDGQCSATPWNGNTVECDAYGQTTEDGKRIVWMMACAQQKNETNSCGRLTAGTYAYEALKKDSICDPNNASQCFKRDRILMKLHSQPADLVYTAVETDLK